MSAAAAAADAVGQAGVEGGGNDDAPSAAPPPATTSLRALYAGYNDDDDDDDAAFDEDDDHAFGDAFAAVLARVPQLMGAVVDWAAAAKGGGGGGGRAAAAAAAAEALEALSAHPLLPDDVLGGEQWLDLCAALPVCLFGGGGENEQAPAAAKDDDNPAATVVSAAAAHLLRFLAPALLAGSGGCIDALATVLTPLLNYMAQAGRSRCFSVRWHAEAASAAASALPPLAAETPDAIAMQFALVGLHRLGRQWHLLDPGLGPGLAAGVCALLAAAVGGEPDDDDDDAPPATAAQALLAWEPDAAWWHRLCAVTAPSVDLAAAGPGGLLRALVVRRRWDVVASSSSSSSRGGGSATASLEAVAVHVLAGVLGAPALRRALLLLEEEQPERGAGDGGAAPSPPPPSPLWGVLLRLGTCPPAAHATTASTPHERAIADAARAAARAVVARLTGPEVPAPEPTQRWRAEASAALSAAAADVHQPAH